MTKIYIVIIALAAVNLLQLLNILPLIVSPFCVSRAYENSSNVRLRNEVTITKNLAPVIVSSDDTQPINIEFNLSDHMNGVVGKYKLDSATCACSGSLPESVEFKQNITTSIQVRPRVQLSGEIKANTWRVRYVRESGLATDPGITLNLTATLIPRLRYVVLQQITPGVVICNENSCAIQIDTFSTRRKDEPFHETTVELADTTKIPVNVSRTESEHIYDPSLNVETTKTRFEVLVSTGTTGLAADRAAIRLLAKCVGGGEVFIPLTIAKQSVIRAFPSSAFISKKNRKGSQITLSADTPFTILEAELLDSDLQINADFGVASTRHQLSIEVPNVTDEEIAKQKEIKAAGGVLYQRRVLKLVTDHGKQPELHIPILSLEF